MLKTQTTLPLRLWTVQEYHQMVEAGILQPDEKVELVAGQIIKKISPQGSLHAAAIRRTERLLRERLGKQVLIQTQLPIELNDFSEPEPDVAVVRVDPLDYEESHPKASDVYLIIEVADSTLKRDCELKAKDYAQSGIVDYWVLDVKNQQLRVFREPTEDGYQSEVVLGEDGIVSPLLFRDCRIAVADLLRSHIRK
ncbi:Uma2 family endonuclease [Lyngbya aestuarii]|uniref:Uma2 family endonuclease n=1 Tax=Lyngbya aestuarii TaxID=118322 RepID=UPI00403DE101